MPVRIRKLREPKVAEEEWPRMPSSFALVSQNTHLTVAQRVNLQHQQIMSEYRALLKLVGKHGGTKQVSETILAAVNANTGLITNGIARLSVANQRSLGVWYVHSGTAAYMYGIRGVLGDIDVHSSPLYSNAQKTRTHHLGCFGADDAATAALNHVARRQVDAYDPSVAQPAPGTPQWALDMWKTNGGGNVIQFGGVNVCTAGQLVAEYTFLAAGLGIPYGRGIKLNDGLIVAWGANNKVAADMS